MLKKMMLLAVAVAALVAFAGPAVAQAKVTVTDSEGNALANGTEVVATSSNLVSTTGSGTLACPDVEIKGKVGNNGTANAHITGVTVKTTTECPINPLPFPTVRAHITEALVVGGTISLKTGTGSAPATFVYDIYQGATKSAKCHFEGTIGFTFPSGSDTLTVPGSNLTGKTLEGSGCAAEGKMEGSFTLTAGGESAFLDY